MRLRDWQKAVIRKIYDGTPIPRRVILSIGRKNAKTTLAAMLLLAHLIGPEARRNGQIYSAAQSREQAAIVFKLASKMVRLEEELARSITVRDSAKELFCTLTGVFYKALSADATTAYGFSPVLVIHDELGHLRSRQQRDGARCCAPAHGHDASALGQGSLGGRCGAGGPAGKPSGGFVEAAFKVAVVHWGLRPGEFWRLTPREWWWLHDAKKPPRMYGSLSAADVAELYDETYGVG